MTRRQPAWTLPEPETRLKSERLRHTHGVHSWKRSCATLWMRKRYWQSRYAPQAYLTQPLLLQSWAQKGAQQPSMLPCMCCPLALYHVTREYRKQWLSLQLDALKSAMRQMAEEKDAAIADALAPLQEQLQVWRCHDSRNFVSEIAGRDAFSKLL